MLEILALDAAGKLKLRMEYWIKSTCTSISTMAHGTPQVVAGWWKKNKNKLKRLLHGEVDSYLHP